MKGSPRWSTNEVEKRYAPQSVDGAKYLLRIDDPESEGQDLSQLSSLYKIPEPSEFMSILRSYAYDTVENAINGNQPLIKEDMLFVELEVKRQKKANQKDEEEKRELKPLVIVGALAVALYIGTLLGMDAKALLFVGAFFGLIFGVSGGYQWWQSHSRIRRRLNPLLKLDSAADIYRNRKEYWESDSSSY